MYALLFAHPSVEAVTGWDFADGAWLGAPSGLIAADNRIKPAYRALDRLINGQWRTECDLVTDAEGRTEATGFKGGYALSDGVREGALRIERTGEAAVVTIR